MEDKKIIEKNLEEHVEHSKTKKTKKKSRAKKVVLKTVIALAIAGVITASVKFGNFKLFQYNKDISFVDNFKQSISALGNEVKDMANKVGETINDAKDYAEATKYVAEHKDEVMDTYKQYQNGEITQQEMVDQIAEEIDVEYVYNFIVEHGTPEIKDKVKDAIEYLEKSGVDVYSYLPEGAKDVFNSVTNEEQVENLTEEEKKELEDKLKEEYKDKTTEDLTEEEKKQLEDKLKEMFGEDYEKSLEEILGGASVNSNNTSEDLGLERG